MHQQTADKTPKVTLKRHQPPVSPRKFHSPLDTYCKARLYSQDGGQGICNFFWLLVLRGVGFMFQMVRNNQSVFANVYSAPTVRIYGDVAALTANGSGATTEGKTGLNCDNSPNKNRC